VYPEVHGPYEVPNRQPTGLQVPRPAFSGECPTCLFGQLQAAWARVVSWRWRRGKTRQREGAIELAGNATWWIV
jgi:hypothetical protein